MLAMHQILAPATAAPASGHYAAKPGCSSIFGQIWQISAQTQCTCQLFTAKINEISHGLSTFM